MKNAMQRVARLAKGMPTLPAQTPPRSNEEGPDVCSVEAFKDERTKQGKSTSTEGCDQEETQTLTAYERLRVAFNAVGWNFRSLQDEAMLAVPRCHGASVVCRGSREGSALLRFVRGKAA